MGFEAAKFAVARLESGKFDPAPAPAVPLTPVNSGKSAIDGKTFGHPVETRSAETIIPPIASRDRQSFPSSWTQPSAGKLPAIFTNLAAEAQSGAVSHPNKCHLERSRDFTSEAPAESKDPCIFLSGRDASGSSPHTASLHRESTGRVKSLAGFLRVTSCLTSCP